MPYERLEQILIWLASINCKKCVLIGGEPTLHPRIAEIFASGKALGLAVGVVSNGRRFANPAFCKDMAAAGLASGNITLSMHASSRDDAKTLTGKAESFDEFVSGFENLTQLGIRPAINITISVPLLDKIETMLVWLASHGVDRLTFNEGLPAVSQSGIDASFSLPPDRLGQETVRLFHLATNLGIRPIFLFNLPYCVLPRTTIEELLEAGSLFSDCHVKDGTGVVFNVREELVACNHLLDYPIYDRKTVRDSLRDGHLTDLLQDNRITKVRRTVCVYRSPLCVTCDFWNLCGGGCPVLWAYYNPLDYMSGWIEGQEK